MATKINDAELVAWWGAWRDRSLRALRLALGLRNDLELMQRLGVEGISDLRLELPEPTQPARTRGRPRRQIDRDLVVGGMQDALGNVRKAARSIGLPLSTLQEYLKREPVPEHIYAYGHGLRPDHCALLHRSGVSPDVARARAYQSGKLGLDIPVWSVHGHHEWVQTRLDQPRSGRHRYRNPPQARAMIDVSPYGRGLVLDGERTLYVAESPREADAAVSIGLACVAVQGARMISLDADEWNYVGVKDRDVVIAFDGDAAYKPDVRAAERRLWERLTELGARVRVAVLPAHQGLDDYLAGGRSIDQLEVTGYSTARPP